MKKKSGAGKAKKPVKARKAKSKKLTRAQAKAILAEASNPKGRKPKRERISAAALTRRTGKAAPKPGKKAPPPPAADMAVGPEHVQKLFEMMMGFMVTKAISAAAKLGIADALARGPRYYIALASDVGADQKALHRLMRALTSVGLFGETAPGTYTLTPLSHLLRSDVPGSQRDMAVMITSPSHWLPWGRLEDTIRKGVSVLEEVFGQPLWEYYRQNEAEGAVFNAAMTSFSAATAGALLQAYDFSGFSRIVDVGGGHGYLLSSVLRAAPRAKGVLYDLPQVINSSGAIPKDVAKRIEAIGGDFFREVPAEGDCYILKHIIHDWPDVQCRTILTNIRRAMKPDASVLILDQVLPGETSPHPGFLMDMNMLAMTPGGCERNEKEFRDLLLSSGLKLKRVIATQSPVSIIEGVAA